MHIVRRSCASSRHRHKDKPASSRSGASAEKTQCHRYYPGSARGCRVFFRPPVHPAPADKTLDRAACPIARGALHYPSATDYRSESPVFAGLFAQCPVDIVGSVKRRRYRDDEIGNSAARRARESRGVSMMGEGRIDGNRKENGGRLLEEGTPGAPSIQN